MFIGDIVTKKGEDKNITYTVINYVTEGTVKITVNKNKTGCWKDYSDAEIEDLELIPECVGPRTVPDGVITETELRELLVNILNMKDFEIETVLYESSYLGFRGYQVRNSAFKLSFDFVRWNHIVECLIDGFDISYSYDHCTPTLENVESILKQFKVKLDKVIVHRKQAISILCD